MQPDNSTFISIKTINGNGPIALIEVEDGNGKREHKAFDILALNKTIQNIEKNHENAKTEASQEFYKGEKDVFENALVKLREAKKI